MALTKDMLANLNKCQMLILKQHIGKFALLKIVRFLIVCLSDTNLFVHHENIFQKQSRYLETIRIQWRAGEQTNLDTSKQHLGKHVLFHGI